ncbi:leucine--tRNA ligase [Membranicola marinus]|uniref:Leucine--tRNA ligase n=1 Tax=Membranihabitans marinus TaxID=1227546 RepID=A0A953HPL8_9BACT|nr:class I tRNA ligase family protein [Membranihabitans marinus]MBY5958924.1 leucine--tRNA ligase [Membranihabitans marinus]
MIHLDFDSIESKWKTYWEENNIYTVSNDSSRPKYYVLDMFPYPSGAGLHVGHPLGYIASDIYARQKRMSGYNVLHPIGFDSFGLPAEQYALQTGIHPAISTKNNMERYREQLSNLGFSFDWNRQVATSVPEYYRWTQWLFIKLFSHYYDTGQEKARPIDELIQYFSQQGNENCSAHTDYESTFTAKEWKAFDEKTKSDILMHYRLAYLKTGYVNWCEELGTVLANDQIKDGVSERGGYPVVRKAMTQWYLRITAYADRLLQGLNDIDWPQPLKTMQENWIGKSTGATIYFELIGSDKSLEIYTTRPDTLFGATFMVLAPEHEYVSSLTTAEQNKEVGEYIEYVNSRSDIERMAEKKVTGVFTGSYARHPFSGEKIPVYISEYVLVDYGTGAIMAVPADDERDHAFATKYNIPIIEVVDRSEYPDASREDKVGKMINSSIINGMEVREAIPFIIEQLEQRGIGHLKVNYRLRDANFSRQRYWGEPIPIIYDKNNIPRTVPLDELPVELPDTDDFRPATNGRSPLAKLDDWVQYDKNHTRETDTMPAVAGSSWYYLRYMDPHNENALASPEAIAYWQNVDLYVGGAEHAVAHLMYARFMHMTLHDLDYVPTSEPFEKLINQGKIQGTIESILLKKNTTGTQEFYSADLVEEDQLDQYAKIPVLVDFVSDYGQENSYLSKKGLDQYTDWAPDFKNATFYGTGGTYQNGQVTDGDEESVVIRTISEQGKMSKSKYNVINPDDIISQYGADCFRMYEMFLGPIEQDKPWDTNGIEGVFKFIRRIWSLFTDEADHISLSTDEPSKAEWKILHTAIKKVEEDSARFSFNTCISAMMVAVNDLKKARCNKVQILNPLTRLIAPFAPFLAEELWEMLGESPSVHQAKMPVSEEKYLVDDEVEYPLCINGKKRATAYFDTGLDKKELEEAALHAPELQKWLEGKSVVKVIVVPGRMINFVVK